MHLLIVSATLNEIRPTVEYITRNSIRDQKNLFQISYQNQVFDILITGPGMNMTAFQLGNQFAISQYDLCINAGIAGAFDKAIEIGETVMIRSEQFGQAGAEDGDKYLDLFEMGLLDKNEFPFSNGMLINQNHFQYESIKKLKKVNAITVETVHGNELSIQKIISRFKPAVESMEGAAFFYACLMKNYPFMEIRAVSNYVERRNKLNWNIPLAVENLNRTVLQFIEEITT